MRNALAVFVLLLLAGCATEPVGLEATHPVPATRIYAATKSSGMASVPIVVARDIGGSVPPNCSTQLFLDGRHAADIRPGEVLTLHVSPGQHILSARMEQFCGRGVSELAIDARTPVPTVRLSNNAANEPQIQFTAFSSQQH